MATDPLSTPSLAAGSNPSSNAVIENEFPTYRAISRSAVFSFLFGLMSVACFVDPWYFLALPILAILTGFLALRGIKRYSDILTGEKLAQMGIALGLSFGLMAITFSTVQRYIYTKSAARFAEGYVEVLQKGTFGDMLLYGLPPKARTQTTPEQLAEESRAKSTDPASGPMAEARYGPYQRIMARIASGGDQHIEFQGIENIGMDEDKPFASAIFKIHGKPSKDFPDEEQYIGALLKSSGDGSEAPWYVDQIQFPFSPKSSALVPTAKPVDDGHGHAH